MFQCKLNILYIYIHNTLHYRIFARENFIVRLSLTRINFRELSTLVASINMEKKILIFKQLDKQLCHNSK